jgi:hypothetical protein
MLPSGARLTPARWLNPAGVILASCAGAWLIYRKLILSAGTLSWDESGHALWGLLIAHDISERDWLSLIYDTYRQVFWPPIHAWLTAASFFAFGVSNASARLVSAVSYAALGPLVYLTGRRLAPQRPEVAGWVAAALALSSPFVITRAGRCMLDVPALIPFVATLLIYFKLVDEQAPPRRFAWVGVLILATYFTRTNYAVLLVLAIGLSHAVGGRFSLKSLAGGRNFWIALPIAAALAVWFAYPPKLLATWEALVNISPNPEETFQRSGLLFYPRAFVRESGALLLFLLYLIATLFAIRSWRDEKARVTLLPVVLLLLLGQFHHSKASRYILPAFPALFLLAGRFAACWWARRTRAAALATAVVLVYGLSLPRTVSPFWPQRMVAETDLVRSAGDKFRQARTSMLLATWDFMDAPVLDWRLATEEGALSVAQAGFLGQVQQRKALAAALRRLRFPESTARPALRVLERIEQPQRNFTRYLGALEPATVQLISSELARPDVDQVILITSTRPRATTKFSDVDPLIQRLGWRGAATEYYPSFEGRLDLYRRAPADESVAHPR